MIKITSPDSQDFGVPAVEMVKQSSRGLRGDDLKSFIKRAGHEFADKLRDVNVAPGEQLVHLIAIGATESYGPNRNGDGFKSATCRKYHPTFVKHARWYRNHQNKDEAKSYGIIKMSAFNEAMKRIELLVALNGTKEAADRNKGLVADKEMQKIASGSNDWGVSMACRVPFDVCSGCGNKAANRSTYCTERNCKYGGCYNNLTKVAADGHVIKGDYQFTVSPMTISETATRTSEEIAPVSETGNKISFYLIISAALAGGGLSLFFIRKRQSK